MTNTIGIAEWLDVIDSEYLSTFIRAGGGAVKFAIASEEGRTALRETLEPRCGERDYVFVALDAIERRFHMPQDIFFGIAAQIDWRFLARRLILRLFVKENYSVENIDPRDTLNIVEEIAQVNGLESQYLLAELRPALQKQVFNNRNVAKAFRVAMTHLCRLEASAQKEYAGQPIIDWLTGANTRLSYVRDFQIYTAIDRTTARYFIESALYWVRFAGYSGTVICMDNSRIFLSRNPRDGNRYYTKAMVVDHYELLREFIDDIDRLTGTLLLVATDRAFVDDDHRARGWGMYNALKTRVMDDVRDRNIVNPAASLVRIS